MAFEVAQSSCMQILRCCGHGLEPCIHFDRTTLEFPSTIPFYASEQEIVVCNPCCFPVEFYSVDFDQIYLEDEKVILEEFAA